MFKNKVIEYLDHKKVIEYGRLVEVIEYVLDTDLPSMYNLIRAIEFGLSSIYVRGLIEFDFFGYRV